MVGLLIVLASVSAMRADVTACRFLSQRAVARRVDRPHLLQKTVEVDPVAVPPRSLHLHQLRQPVHVHGEGVGGEFHEVGALADLDRPQVVIPASGLIEWLDYLTEQRAMRTAD